MPRIGSVANDYSNYLAILVADSTIAAEYRATDFDRACKAENKKEFAIGKGKGVVVEIGSCGQAEVHRLGTSIVVPEIYPDEEDADSEAALDVAIAMHPTTKPKLIGTIDVPSGVVVLTGLLESGQKVDPTKVAKKGFAKTKAGVAISVEPGRHDVWREDFKKEVEGAWGTMPSRVRVVPHGTKLAEGKPIAELAAAGATHQPTPGGQRRLVDRKDKWAAIQSLALADDGRIFAGESGRFGVAAWDANGKLLWQRVVRPSKKKAPDYMYSVHIALAGNDLLALCNGLGEIVVLDSKTGKEKRKVEFEDARSLRVVGDRVVLRASIETTVLSYPGWKKLAFLEEYANGDGIAVSSDGKWLAVHGHEWHVYDWKTLKHVRTVELNDDPSDVAFTPDGKLVTVDDKSRIKLWDPKSGKQLAVIDGAKERGRKPGSNVVRTSARHIAIGREDGAVAVIDSKTKKTAHLFEKLLVAVPGTGATELCDIAFTKDGKTLWVSTGPKGSPIGLTAYTLG
jgi:hypothetical protein